MSCYLFDVIANGILPIFLFLFVLLLSKVVKYCPNKDKSTVRTSLFVYKFLAEIYLTEFVEISSVILTEISSVVFDEISPVLFVEIMYPADFVELSSVLLDKKSSVIFKIDYSFYIDTWIKTPTDIRLMILDCGDSSDFDLSDEAF